MLLSTHRHSSGHLFRLLRVHIHRGSAGQRAVYPGDVGAGAVEVELLADAEALPHRFDQLRNVGAPPRQRRKVRRSRLGPGALG